MGRSSQHILRGAAQRHTSEPQRTEGSQELLFLQGYAGARVRHLLNNVRIMLAGADAAGSKEHSTAVAAENPSHGGRIDGLCLVIGGVDRPNERSTKVGHQGSLGFEVKGEVPHLY